jgi:hypothetical protein
MIWFEAIWFDFFPPLQSHLNYVDDFFLQRQRWYKSFIQSWHMFWPCNILWNCTQDKNLTFFKCILSQLIFITIHRDKKFNIKCIHSIMYYVQKTIIEWWRGRVVNATSNLRIADRIGSNPVKSKPLFPWSRNFTWGCFN